MNDHATPAVPAGYMLDAAGSLVPESKVSPQDKLQDEMVRRLAMSAVGLSETLAAFKAAALEQAGEFRDLLAQEYGVKRGGRRGNVTYRSFDGRYEMQVAVGDYLSFGPELQAAKSLIDACVQRWSEGANDNIRALVDHAFQVNKAGRIDTHRVLGLRRLDIDDAEWKRAMEAIGDALRVTASRTYLRFYTVDPDTGARAAIPLDLASV
jgi:hypothetical protein